MAAAAAAPQSGPLLLLLLAVLAVGLAAGQLCRNNATNFRFDSFDCLRDRQLICTGDATTTVDGQLNLTRYDMKSWGRVMVAQGFRLMDRVSSRVAYFSTNFTFSMKADYSRPGEGLAFVMQASRGYQGHSGGFLGIYDRDGKSGTPTIAVEFDTYREWIYGLFLYNDINNNHVGVDIESINSKAQVDAGTVGIDLGRENAVTAWVDYVPASEISEGNLQVRISIDNVRPLLPLISYDVDLSKHISEIMYLGFSATTGDHMVTSDCLSYHNILNWSFDSWWEDSDPPPSSPPPSPPVAPPPPPSILPPVPLPPEPPSPVPPVPLPPESPSPSSHPPSGFLPPFPTPSPSSFPSPTWSPSPSPSPSPSSVSPPSPNFPAPGKPVPPGPVPAPAPVLSPSPASSPSPFTPAITPSLTPTSGPSPSADSAPSTSPAAPASVPSAASSPGSGNANSTDSPAPVPAVPTSLPPSIPAPAPSSSSSSASPPSPATPHLDSTRPVAVSIAGFALLFSFYAVAVYTRVLSELREERRGHNRHSAEYHGDQIVIGIWPTDR